MARPALGLVVPLLLAGCTTSTQATPRSVQSATNQLPPVTKTTTPSVPELTVREIVDARTVVLSDGSRVQVEGLAAPGECWANAAVAFAAQMLVGKPVRITRNAVSPVRLADGTDYALLAVGQGVARAETPKDMLLEAQNAAQKAALGLWGPPCGGVDAKPTTPPPAVTTTTKPPTTTSNRFVFFFSCEEAERAGAAPIRRGEPGYRLDLDKNRNGIACE